MSDLASAYFQRGRYFHLVVMFEVAVINVVVDYHTPAELRVPPHDSERFAELRAHVVTKKFDTFGKKLKELARICEEYKVDYPADWFDQIRRDRNRFAHELLQCEPSADPAVKWIFTRYGADTQKDWMWRFGDDTMAAMHNRVAEASDEMMRISRELYDAGGVRVDFAIAYYMHKAR